MGLGLTTAELLLGAGAVGGSALIASQASDKGQLAPIVPQPIDTETDIGSKLDTTVETFDESKKDERTVNKNKLGTKGLQIPLTPPSSTTTSASTTGLRV